MRRTLGSILVRLGFFCVVCGAGNAGAQDLQNARALYLQEIGFVDRASALEEYLRTELDAQGVENAQGLSEFFSFVMSIHGLDAEKVERLEAGGIDIVHAMTSDARPFMEQGLFSTPAIVGEVLKLKDSDASGDGYRSTVEVRVLEILKGTVDADTVILRQRGRFAESPGPRGFVPEVGARYLLLLSRPMYEFFAWRRAIGDSTSPDPARGHYAIYRSYRADEGRIIMGDGSSYHADDVYRDLRWLQELIEEL